MSFIGSCEINEYNSILVKKYIVSMKVSMHNCLLIFTGKWIRIYSPERIAQATFNKSNANILIIVPGGDIFILSRLFQKVFKCFRKIFTGYLRESSKIRIVNRILRYSWRFLACKNIPK